MKKETIAFISTPIGEGGIGVIVVSGPDSLEIVNKVFRGKKLEDLRNAESGRLYYGDIYSDGLPVDEVIVNVLRGQGSFTGEDLVEVNCHGGILAVKKALECIASAGAKKADWKDITVRSFKNNRIDRIQEEALLEIPGAKTRLSVKVLLDQYNGALSSCVYGMIEEIEKRDNMINKLYHVNDTLRDILSTSAFGFAITSPQRLVIMGKPNAGKSTLINALLKEDRLITHEEPGTTRDSVDELISINDIPFTIIDTAGIRETEHEVERLGVLESKRQLQQADKIIVVFDSSRPVEKEDREIIKYIETLVPGKRESSHNISVFPVINKTDLPRKSDLSALIDKTFKPVCQISALNGNGISTLEKKLVSEYKEFTKYTPERPIIFTRRQKDCISGALRSSEKCIHLFNEDKDTFKNYLLNLRTNLLNCITYSHDIGPPPSPPPARDNICPPR